MHSIQEYGPAILVFRAHDENPIVSIFFLVRIVIWIVRPEHKTFTVWQIMWCGYGVKIIIR